MYTRTRGAVVLVSAGVALVLAVVVAGVPVVSVLGAHDAGPGRAADDRGALYVAGADVGAAAAADRARPDGQTLALDYVAVAQSQQGVGAVALVMRIRLVARHVDVRVLDRLLAAQAVLQ